MADDPCATAALSVLLMRLARFVMHRPRADRPVQDRARTGAQMLWVIQAVALSLVAFAVLCMWADR